MLAKTTEGRSFPSAVTALWHSLALVVMLLCSFSAFSQSLSQPFDSESVASHSNTDLTLGAFSFQFFLDNTASDRGYFSVNNNGASDLGSGADLYLIAMGENTDTNNLRAVSTEGNFRLQSIVVAKGVFGSAAVKVQGLLNGAVQGTADVPLPDNAPGQNAGQLVDLSGPQWAPLDGFRIITSDGSTDFDLELDDIQAVRYCYAGTYLDGNTATCLLAGPGYFVPIPEATGPIPCTPGSFQNLAGQADCSPAPPGSFVSIPAAVVSIACPLGRYQNLSGQSTCKVSPPGSFVDITGAIGATACPVGTFQDQSEATTCQPCPADTLQSVDRTSCITPAPPETPSITDIEVLDEELRIEFSSVALGTEVVLYTIRCTDGQGGSISVEVDQSPAYIGGLTNGVSYQCTIQASNALGVSDESVASGAVPEAILKGLNLILIKAALDVRPTPE